MSLTAQVISGFKEAFGYEPASTYHAPGRVNLIGEHTDYNDGFVLPAAINFGTVVAASPRSDNTVRICALNFHQEVVEFSLQDRLEKSTTSTWANYVRAVADTLLKANFTLQGVDICVIGDVPYGAGLSSSAALEIVLIRMFADLNQLSISSVEAAQYGQRAENDFIGAQTGIMDQLISAQGQDNHALLIDCRSLTSQAVPMDADFRIVIFNSNVQRGLVDSEYNTRRRQCQLASDLLKVPALRDASLDDLERARPSMDSVIYRRARHIISENARTLDAATALRDRDWQTMGRLMHASHESMKDDFEITVPAIDGLVDIIRDALTGKPGGVRMTGGGFGGCVVSLVHRDQVDAVIARVADQYEKRFGIKESVYICRAVNGAFVA
ncbi:galactokinase [Reinekea blandensis]|uniref:Galactokinase n=1 Tax=Reinekea blandensis MED297 TaxID=314283 RepID=A4BEP8_9GAMM|nr:galactokinase [Reinekea blandensis]EAR09475.1 galactokinase [Reinekea sp. MED297] [Reinekea blandensis MED297]